LGLVGAGGVEREVAQDFADAMLVRPPAGTRSSRSCLVNAYAAHSCWTPSTAPKSAKPGHTGIVSARREPGGSEDAATAENGEDRDRFRRQGRHGPHVDRRRRLACSQGQPYLEAPDV